MDVKKIFTMLIVVVACILVGVLVLNFIMPNAMEQLVDAIEAQIYNATGISFDFNGNGKSGGDGGTEFHGGTAVDGEAADGAAVEGLGGS